MVDADDVGVRFLGIANQRLGMPHIVLIQDGKPVFAFLRRIAENVGGRGYRRIIDCQQHKRSRGMNEKLAGQRIEKRRQRDYIVMKAPETEQIEKAAD